MVASNGEYLAELVRAHYDRDERRFANILLQIIASERRARRWELVERLESLWQDRVEFIGKENPYGGEEATSKGSEEGSG